MKKIHPNELNIHIGHDWINGMRGGERVLHAILEIFPKATIDTFFYEKGKSDPFIDARIIHAHFFNKIPWIRKHYRYLLPFFPLMAETFSLDNQIDVFISSNHCLIKGIKKDSQALHISYIHSPMRYIYDQFDSYFKGPLFILASLLRPFLQTFDRITNNDVDTMIANSFFVQQRIKNYYKRDSSIIYPFVDLEDFPLEKVKKPKSDYFIMVGALAPNKRVDLAVKAFMDPSLLDQKLKIIGDGQLKNQFSHIKTDNIEFLGPKKREELIDFLAGAKALIFPGVEDFGITPLESLASLTPVIAYKAAGALETLNEKVAVFFDEPNVDSLIEAIKNFQNDQFSNGDLRAQADKFSRKRFQEEFFTLVQRELREKRGILLMSQK